MNSVVVTPTPENSAIAEVGLDEEPPGTKPPPATPPVLHPQSGPSVMLPTLCMRPPRGIVVLYSQTERLDQAEGRDILADLETIATARAVAQVLEQYTNLDVHLLSASQHVERKLGPFPPEDYLVFNLFEGVDGLIGEDGDNLLDEEARAARVLQERGYRFTGADVHALSLALNKAQTKALLEKDGILTPPWRVFAHPDEVSETTLSGLNFPLIVKPVAEDSSLGVDIDAVVTSMCSLRERVAYVTARYRQPALVETFIDGREFNVGLWGNPPQVLPLAEVDLSALGEAQKRIVSFAAKWEESSFEYLHTPVTCPAVVSEELAARIRETALRAWGITGCRCGYARIDMRVQSGQVYVLEINPNPSIAPDAGFARAARAAGLDYAQMILHILSLVGEDLHVHNSPS